MIKKVSLLASLLLFVPVLPAFGAGGDNLGQFGDTPQSGKQEALASVIDSAGNIITTGYRNVGGGTNDAYYTVKFNTYSSSVSWRAVLDKSTDSDRAAAVAVDAEKNIIVTGYVWNGLNKDIHTVKYNGTSGAIIWEHTFNGAARGNDVATAVALDSLNNIYVTGYTQNSDGNNDFLVLKYSSTGPNSEGKPAWQVTFDGRVDFPGYPDADKPKFVDQVNAIAVGSDALAVSGYSWNGTDFDYLTIKYDLGGGFLWKKRYSSSGINPDMAQYVKMDDSGNVVVTGFTSNVNDKDITTVKYSSNGNLAWEKTFNGGFNDEPGGLAVDAAGDAYITGYTFTLTGNKDFYTVKYRNPPSGTVPQTVWEKSFNSAGENPDVSNAIFLDASGNVYVSGSTFANSTYDFQTVKYKNAVGGALNNDGTELWHSTFDGDAHKSDIPVGLGFSAAATVPGIYVTGWSEQATSGDYDYYVVKYDQGALNPPSNLTAGTLVKDGISGNYTIPLSWTVNSTTEAGFIVERKDPGSSNYLKLTTVPDPLPAGTANYADTGLTEDRYYCYRVKAVSSAGDSSYSDPLCVLSLIITPINPDWNYHYNGRNDSDDFITGIAVGPDNHPVVTGYSLDFAPGYNEGTVSTDYVTIKLKSTDKSLLWEDQFEGGFNQEDDAKGLAVDSNNNVVVTGNSFQDVGGGENINSIYTIKYGSGAPTTRLWHGQYNGPSQVDDRAKSVAAAIDGSNNSVVIGHGKNVAGNEDIYVFMYPSNPSLDTFGRALPAWTAVPYDGGGDDYPDAVAFDKDGNVFITGHRETVPGTHSYDIFTAKYCGSGTANPTCNGKNKGEQVWSDIYNGDGNGDDQPRGLAVDNNGDVYVTGYALNNAATKNDDYVVLKFNGTTGARVWAAPGIFDSAFHGSDRAVAIRIDPIDNNVIVTGTSETGAGDHDFHTVRYTAAGSLVWERTHRKSASDENANAMGMDLSGNIIIVGNTTAGVNTDALTISYDYQGNLIGESIYNNSAVTDGIDDAVTVTVNGIGEAFVGGYSTNGSTGPNGPNADYLVYKIPGVSLQAPYPFTATSYYTTAVLSWTDNPGTETGFDLERKVGTCASTSNPWLALTVSPLAAGATSHTDSGLTEGQSYCYRVRAFAGSGRPSRWIERQVTMLNPPAPGNFTATAANTTSVGLAWTDNTTGESAFQLERCEGAACTFQSGEDLRTFTAAANAQAFTDDSVCPAKSYRYRILAYKDNQSGTGIEWDSEFAMTTPVTTPGTSVPGGISITPLNESQIRINWTDTNSDESGYRVYECTVEDCTVTTLVGTTAADATSFTITGLASNSSHKYQVKAYKNAPLSCNGGWESLPAGPVATTTINNAPLLTATKVNTTQIDLSWTDVTASETGFELQRCTSGNCTLDEHFTTINVAAPGVTVTADNGVCQGSTNQYRIRAVNEGLSHGGAGTWSKRALLNITGFQPNFQTKVVITKANFPEMRADYADIRFYDETSKSELSYWIDPGLTTASSATVWVRTGSNNNIYLYYGNAVASSSTAGSATFDFFDDFSGTTLGTAWSKSSTGSGTIMVGGGVVALDAPGYANASISRSLAAGNVVEARVKLDTARACPSRVRALTTGIAGDAGFFCDSGSPTVYFNGWSGVAVPMDQFFRLRIAYTGGATNPFGLYNDTTGAQIYANTHGGTPNSINFTVADGTSSAALGKISLDWIYTRKYTATEPAVTIGTAVTWGSSFTNTWTGAWSTPLVSRATDAAVVPSAATAARISEAENRITLNYSFGDVTGIKVDRCTDSSCTAFARNMEVAPGTATVSDNTGLLPDTTYYYLVHGYKTATCGWDTKDITPVIVSATTTLQPPVINTTATTSITTTCNDLRFVDSDGITPLNYWIEFGCNTSRTKVHVKIPTIAANNVPKQIALYFGNPAAAAKNSGALTFDFFDNFSGSNYDASKWTLTAGVNNTDYSVANGLLRGKKTDFILTSVQQWSTGYSIQAKAKTTALAPYGLGQTTLSLRNGAYNSGWQIHDDNTVKFINNGTVLASGAAPAGAAITDNIVYTLAMPDATTVSPASYDVEPTVLANFFVPSSAATRSFAAGNIVLGRSVTNTTAGYAYTTDWDWVRVRKSSATVSAAFTLLDVPVSGSYLIPDGLGGNEAGTWGARRLLTVTNTGTSAATNWQTTIDSVNGVTLDTTALASDQVGISWTPSTATEERYVIARCEGELCSPTTFGDGIQRTLYGAAATSAYTDREVRSGTKYCYRVSAERHATAPLWITSPSGVVCITTAALPVAPVLTVTEHETTMDLAWNDVGTGETSYLVQRCTGTCDPVTAPELTLILGPNSIAYTDSTVCNNTYSYAVKAVKYGANAWDSGFSNVVTRSTITPEKPLLVTATRISENQVNLVWQDKTGDETGFEIDRCEGSACDFTTKSTLLAPASIGVGGMVSYTDTALKPNVIYRYQIRAYKTGNPCGWPSEYSLDVREVTTAIATATALSGTSSSSTSVNLTWSDFARSDSGFRVERCIQGGSCAAPMDFASTVQPATKRVFYSFNGTLADSSGNGLHLTGATPTYEDGGLALATTSSFQSATTSILNNDSHAIEFDFKIRATNSDWKKIFGYNPGTSDRSPGIWLKNGNSPTLHWRYHNASRVDSGVNALGLDGDGNIPFSVGQWYHVRGVKSGTSFKAYVDGILVSDTTVANPKFAGDAALWFGGADVTIKNFSIDWNESPINVADNNVCSDTTYNYKVKALNNLTLPNSGGGCWTSRSVLTITNFQANFLTRLVIPYDPEMQSDYRDLRFTDTVANVDLPYWIESSSASSATVWFKTGTNNAITLSYGNPAAIAQSSQAAIFGTGLVGYWPFNESAGTYTGSTADLSGKGNSLTLTGFTSGNGVIAGGIWGTGNNALSVLSGMYAKNNTPNSLPTGAVSSVEAWIYPKGYYDANYNGIVSWGSRACDGKGFAFGMHGQGRPELATWCNDAVYTTGPTATLNAWNHVAVVQTGASVDLYLNGQKTTTSLNKGVTPSLTSINLAIGALDYPGRYFNGLIDEVRVYDRALSSTEIASRYATILPTVAIGTKIQPGGGCSSYQYEGSYSAPYTVVTPAIGGNLIPSNADFSNNLTGWTTWGTGVTADSTVFSGMKSMKVSTLMASGSQSAGATQVLNIADIVVGKSYKLYANIKTNLDKSATSTTLAFCRLDSASGNPDTLGREHQIQVISAWNDNAWHHMTPLDVTIKAGTTAPKVVCGIWSADGQNKTHSAWFTGLQLVPNPIIELAASRSSEAQINLSWKDVIPDKSAYRLERCDLASCAEGDFVQIGADLPASTLNYVDVVPVPNIPYTYRIKAVKAASCNWSVTSNSVTLQADVTTPLNLTATAVNTTRIDLSWGNSTATETGFIVERCTDAGSGCSDFSPDFIPAASQPGPGATSFSDTTVCNNTSYRYQLKSYKDGLSQGGGTCWTRRKDLTVANHVPAFQMRYTVTKDSDMKADYSDLRFYDTTANIELPYWIESYDGTSAKIWIKTGTSSTIQMYYGNANATSVSNASRVFEFYDNFSGTTLDSGKWNKVDPGNVITQNNELLVNGGGSWGTGIYSVQNFPRPFVFEINALNPTGTYQYSAFGIKNSGTGIALANFVHEFYWYWTNTPGLRIYEGSTDRLDTGTYVPYDAYKYFRIDALPTGAKFYYGDSIDAAAKYYDSSYSSESPLKIGFTNSGRVVKLDNARVRRYASVAPTVSSTGSEVVLASCPVFTGQWSSAYASAQATTPAPVAPTGLTVQGITDTRIDLSWSDGVPDETGFRIERCLDGGGGCTPAAMSPAVLLGAGQVSYQDMTVLPSSGYCYQVRATKTASCGWDSAATGIACTKAFPANAGSTLTATPVNSRAIRLRWADNASDETGYELVIKLWNGRWVTIATLASGTVEFVHTQGLEPNKTYTYMVRPFRITEGVTEYSPYSSPASATTPLFGDSPPTCP
jgi:uncharacterized delta-60 repeat protein